MEMGRGSRLCLCLLLAFLVVASARNSVFLSEEETTVGGIEGRSLKTKLDDYAAATANKGHDPRRSASRRGSGSPDN